MRRVMSVITCGTGTDTVTYAKQGGVARVDNLGTCISAGYTYTSSDGVGSFKATRFAAIPLHRDPSRQVLASASVKGQGLRPGVGFRSARQRGHADVVRIQAQQHLLEGRVQAEEDLRDLRILVHQLYVRSGAAFERPRPAAQQAAFRCNCPRALAFSVRVRSGKFRNPARAHTPELSTASM